MHMAIITSGWKAKAGVVNLFLLFNSEKMQIKYDLKYLICFLVA